MHEYDHVVHFHWSEERQFRDAQDRDSPWRHEVFDGHSAVPNTHWNHHPSQRDEGEVHCGIDKIRVQRVAWSAYVQGRVGKVSHRARVTCDPVDSWYMRRACDHCEVQDLPPHDHHFHRDTPSLIVCETCAVKRTRASIALIVFSLTATITACGGSGERTKATFTVTPGWEQVLVTDAVPGDSLSLVADGTEDALQTAVVDAEGVALFRRVDAGAYAVLADGSSTSQSGAVTVKDESETPDATFYSSQQLTAPGFGYVTTRDGTTLSINVSLPGPVSAGPYPTVVEYSGYSPSNPADTTSGQLYNALGYAYVGANMRGTGCSGGSFRFFELMQRLDAYDLIETVAAQPWVKFNKVPKRNLFREAYERLGQCLF